MEFDGFKESNRTEGIDVDVLEDFVVSVVESLKRGEIRGFAVFKEG